MTPGTETLTVVLENVGGTSWWAGLLTILASQSGSTQQRFVGQVDGETRYKSSTFPVAGPTTSIPPQEQWAPGLTAALDELRDDLARDGWEQQTQGSQPWSLTFRRADPSVT